MFVDTIEKLAQKNREKVLYFQGEDTITYNEFYSCAKRTALQFQEKGLSGECIAFSLPNSIDLAILFFATFMAGGIALPIDPSFKQSQRDYILDQG